MFNQFNLKCLLAISVLGSFAAQGTQETNNQAPTATVEETKIKHWSEPAIKRTFWDIAELEKAFISVAPTNKNDGITVGELGINGANKDMILTLAQEIADKKHSNVDSLLIAHNGDLVFESYFARGRIDLSHPQSSTTKSYTALAIGRAIQLGYLSMKDLHKPVVSFLKGLDESKFDKGVETITLHKLMTMTSGLQISPEKLEEYQKNPEQYNGIKLVQAFFEDSAPVTEASQTFNYQGANPDVVMQVLDAVVPGSAKDFIENELFDKMGIANYDWRTDKNGLPAAGSFSSITSRDMLKLGSLVMNEGKWKGSQLIPQSFINKATKRNIQLSEEQVKNFYSGDNLSDSGYGYFWWQTDMKVKDKQYLSNSAQGGGGVTILSIDELDLLVIVTAHSRQAYLQMIAERIVPAFI
ncbi:serine hydrolase domain-containing protein [Alteromonas sp. ASW11-130]|uniref:serine hydrolase domain-containing protein n=1 Tax=Alteromonas sp. ASW11-130 TaxID=3015775 RepID=UPI002242C4D2|nr:serine hydrolase [Alteromonas sp. ASW11-130]MCW8091224.1 serine hydrolase [Alteromonas sp. ASW11-130]